MQTLSPLMRAWIALILLSLGSVLTSILMGRGMAPAIGGTVILAFGWTKARIILSRYLGLWRAPSWRRGFNLVLGLYMLLLLGLYLAEAAMG